MSFRRNPFQFQHKIKLQLRIDIHLQQLRRDVLHADRRTRLARVRGSDGFGSRLWTGVAATLFGLTTQWLGVVPRLLVFVVGIWPVLYGLVYLS